MTLMTILTQTRKNDKQGRSKQKREKDRSKPNR